MTADDYPALSPLSAPARGPRTAVLDAWINGREALLARLSGVGPAQVLNPGPPANTLAPAPDLAAELRVSLNRIKAAAINEAGTAVDYDALRGSPAYAAFRALGLARLRTFAPDALPGIAARRAFWINLYNVLVLDAVIQSGVRESVTEGWLGILAFFRRAAYVVGGRRLSLDDIEHGILRANRGHPFLPGPHFAASDPRRAWVLPLDPRLHFALNCGGVSCPPIRAYAADQLDAQLDLATRNFLDGTVRVRPDRDEVEVSRLFKWYAADFGGRAGVRDFVRRYLPEDGRRAYLGRENGRLHLRYASYDWSLNQLV